MLEELCKQIQHCCATLRRSRNKRNVGSCWLKSLTSFKPCTTTSNNIQQHATGCENGRNMWHPTMLRPFARGLKHNCELRLWNFLRLLLQKTAIKSNSSIDILQKFSELQLSSVLINPWFHDRSNLIKLFNAFVRLEFGEYWGTHGSSLR